MRWRTSRNICPYSSGGRIANRVGHIDRGRAGFDGHAHHLDQEIAVRAGGVLGRKLDVVNQRAGQPHRFGGQVQRLLAADLQLVFQMQVARSQKNVNAGAVGKLQRAGGHLDVLGPGAGQGGDARLANGLGDGRDGGKVALRGHGEAGLDDVHAQILQGVGHGELFLRGHAAAGRLLAVAQSSVEEGYVIGTHLGPASSGEDSLPTSYSLSHFGSIRQSYYSLVGD
jgi:hypothetical protein